MRNLVKQFVIACRDGISLPEPIYEFGAYQIQRGYGDLRPLLPGKRYIGADLRAGPGVDVLLDLHKIDLPDDSIGTALVMDTLEHVERPADAIRELHRVLQPEGILLLVTVLAFHIHECPADYWRFTPMGLELLMKPFPLAWVFAVGNPKLPHTVAAVGFKRPSSAKILTPLWRDLQLWQKQK